MQQHVLCVGVTLFAQRRTRELPVLCLPLPEMLESEQSVSRESGWGVSAKMEQRKEEGKDTQAESAATREAADGAEC